MDTSNNQKSQGLVIGLVALSIWSLWAYFFIAIIAGEEFLGISVGRTKAALILIGSAAFISWTIKWLSYKPNISVNPLKRVALFCFVTLISIIGVDVGYGIYINAISVQGDDRKLLEFFRLTDEQIWIGEIRPREYYPTEKNFKFYKPGTTYSATIYETRYHPGFLDSPTLMHSVLGQRKWVRFSIDQHGFRETTPMELARIFALGDSFTEGYIVSQEDNWVEKLEQKISKPTYNLGISGSSPKQQLMLLEYLLETKGSSLQIDELLWMIFEGNDLEESYLDSRPIRQKDANNSVLDGSLFEAIFGVLGSVKRNSVLRQALKHEIVSPLHSINSENDSTPFLIDGVRLRDPLYRSERHGYKIFSGKYIQVAGQPMSYVTNHQNRNSLEETFEEMKLLSEEYDFTVTVVIAPSAPRLYGPLFKDFPEVTEEPHFINFVEELASGSGFDSLNLYDFLKIHTHESELIYKRADTHWNELGNEIVAELIAREVFDSH